MKQQKTLIKRERKHQRLFRAIKCYLKLEKAEVRVYDTMITEINLDCLESIFHFLDLASLINIAESNKQLKPVADLVFNQKYKMMKIRLVKTIEKFAEPSNVCNDINVIHIVNLQFIFKILRLFGKYISEIDVWAANVFTDETLT